MSVFFTSDIHSNDINCNVKYRGFESEEAYQEFLIARWNKQVDKRDKVFIVGDVAHDEKGLSLYSKLNGYKHLVMGNHDNLPIALYLKHFDKVSGFLKYKNCWVSHCPVHSQEIYGRPNIHGHLHSNKNIINHVTPDRVMKDGLIDHRYFNVNIDMNDYKLVPYFDIAKYFEEHNSFGIDRSQLSK
ncbi:MAG: hypothetical protein [Caudoviricetes sp.]|nr:MAG: hypothetical protein [Caudoviricetes sp.]